MSVLTDKYISVHHQTLIINAFRLLGVAGKRTATLPLSDNKKAVTDKQKWMAEQPLCSLFFLLSAVLKRGKKRHSGFLDRRNQSRRNAEALTSGFSGGKQRKNMVRKDVLW